MSTRVGRFGRVSAVLIGASALLLACTSGSGGSQFTYDKGAEATTVDGLHRVKYWGFGAAFVKPGADLQRYDKIMLKEVEISYKRPPRRARQTDDMLDRGNYELSPEAMNEIEKYFHDVFAKELGKSKVYTLTDQPGPDVLRVSGYIVDLDVAAVPFRDQDPEETNYGRSAGELTMILDVRDSKSGEPLVRTADRSSLDYAAGMGMRQSNPVQNSGAVRDLFEREALQLREHLDKIHEYPEIPEPAGSDQPTPKSS
jgi:hypothetical protein